MSVDPRFETGLDDPYENLRAQTAVVFDNLMASYLRDPSKTDAMLRRDGMTKTADRMVEMFGPGWWKDA